jgi:hypothetical protein
VKLSIDLFEGRIAPTLLAAVLLPGRKTPGPRARRSIVDASPSTITFQRGTAACKPIATWEEMQTGVPTADLNYAARPAMAQRNKPHASHATTASHCVI